MQTVEHGFPNQPSALAYDPKLQLMAIGTKSGAIKVYPFQTGNLSVCMWVSKHKLQFAASSFFFVLSFGLCEAWGWRGLMAFYFSLSFSVL